MPRRQHLVFDHHCAARTVKLDDPADVGVGGKAGVFKDRIIDSPGVTLVDETTLLRALLGGDYLPATPIAAPLPRFQVNIQVLGYPHSFCHALFLFYYTVEKLIDYVAGPGKIG